MEFTNGPGAPPAPPDTGTGSRVPSTGALVASAAGMGVLVIADTRLPYLGAWALNTTVILGVSWGIAKYKRNRAAWGCFAGLAAVCAMDPFLALAGLMGVASPVCLAVIVAAVSVWYWLLRFGKVRPPAAPEVQHVVHHHVVHGAQSPAVPVQAAPVTVPGSVVRPAVASVGGRRHLAGMPLADVLQRLGKER